MFSVCKIERKHLEKKTCVRKKKKKVKIRRILFIFIKMEKKRKKKKKKKKIYHPITLLENF